MMAGISKKKVKYKNGKIKIFYTITYRDIHDKQHTHGCYKTKDEAKKHINDFEDINPEITKITFQQIFSAYFQQVKTFAHTTQSNYDLCLKNHLNKLDILQYNKVSSLYLEKFINDISKDYTPFVAQTCLKICKSACNYALRHHLIKENKFLAVNPVIVNPKEKCHLTEEQERKILLDCKDIFPKYYVMLYTLMGTGMRIGELLALNKTDINFEKNQILVNKQFTARKFKNGVKNVDKRVGVKMRYVYITDDLKTVLQEYVTNLHKEATLLFPNNVNGYYYADNIRRRVWKPLLMYSGINNRVRLHDLRGSYADIAFAHKASIKFVQNQLGHAKAETTLNVYAQNNQDMINNALQSLNGVLNNEDL